jgi:hypothetical protein
MERLTHHDRSDSTPRAVIDHEGRYAGANRAWARSLGVDSQDLLGQPYQRLGIGHDERELVERLLREGGADVLSGRVFELPGSLGPTVVRRDLHLLALDQPGGAKVLLVMTPPAFATPAPGRFPGVETPAVAEILEGVAQAIAGAQLLLSHLLAVNGLQGNSDPEALLQLCLGELRQAGGALSTLRARGVSAASAASPSQTPAPRSHS